MLEFPADFRVVTIPSPYDSWANPEVQQLFCKTVAMRLKGYGSEYGAGVFPLDGADFIGAHYIICRDTKSGLVPLMGFRSTTWESSRRHGMTFGGLGLVRAAGAIKHAEALEKILKHCDSHSIPIAYIASWTMDPAVRKDPALNGLLKELFMAVSVLSHQETGTRIIGGCTMRFKVDRWFARWGFVPFDGPDGELSPVDVPFLLGEPVRMMYLKRFTPEILQEAEKWRSVWAGRIVLDAPMASVIPFRKAA